MDDFAAPVKGIVKALENGIKLAKRLSKSTRLAPAAQAQHIPESAHDLQNVLEESSMIIIDAYRHTHNQCGDLFTNALAEDQSLLPRLKELRIDLIDQINECEFDEDDPNSFDPSAFENAQRRVEECCNQCIIIFNELGDRLLQTTLHEFNLVERPKDDSAQLSTMMAARPPAGGLGNSAPVLQAPYQPDNVLVASPTSDYSTDGVNHQISPQSLPYPVFPLDLGRGRQYSEVSPLAEQPPPLIGKEHVYARLSQNEQFLERRRQSRLLFQNEMRNSISPIEENRANQSFSDSSIYHPPTLGKSTTLGSSERPAMSQQGSSGRNERPISPTERSGSWNETLVSLNDRPSSQNDRSRIGEANSLDVSPKLGHSMSPIHERGSASGYGALMTRQRSQGNASQTTRSSRTSSILQDVHLQDRQTTGRKDSQASQESIFGLRNAAPLSPPSSEHRTSGNENWGHLATSLQVPGFGEGVEEGIEVVDYIDRDNGLILVNEDRIDIQPTPSASVTSVDAPMRPDTSFYRFGGFCDGAKALMRAETGFKVMKRPAGHYSATVSARCLKCSYEVGWNDMEKDRTMDRLGIYGNHGVRFRQRFLSKCHVRTHSVDEAMYACIFCIEEHRTVEEHDATIFFSVGKFFQHLAKHSQPVPNIAGLTVLYGFQPPNVLDFDIHFTSPEPKFPQFSMMEIAPKAAGRPSATANTTHHPKNNRSSFRDPEGNPTLHFAAGARIVGITYPERFHGQWCVGYHDGERGSLPANTVTLEMPVREDVLMNAQSNLIAFAKWDFKPKDVKEKGWLKFSKGDRISSVGYTFQDQWCWSGQTGTGSKAKFGLFPAAFVEGLTVAGPSSGKLGTSPGSVKSGVLSGGFGSLGSIIGRHKGSKGHERTASMASSGSSERGGLGGMVVLQPGLEVVHSPIHSTGSWRT